MQGGSFLKYPNLTGLLKCKGLAENLRVLVQVKMLKVFDTGYPT